MMSHGSVGIVVAFVAGTLCGTWSATGEPRKPEADAALRRVASAMDVLHRDLPYHEFSRSELADAAIEGLMMRFDPEGHYFNAEALDDFNQTVTIVRASPSIGARWERRLILTRVDPGSDLERRGLRPGDEIVGLDGAPVDGLSFHDLQTRFRGPPRSHLRVGIRSTGGTPIRSFVVPRFRTENDAGEDVL